METNSGLSHIEKIKNAFETISNSFPINSDKFVEMFNDLTNCEIEYDIFPKTVAFLKLNKRFELRIYKVKDRVYCDENKFIINAKLTDVFDNQKTVSLVLDYKVFSIKQIK
jgi:hypothetical protein